MPIDPSLISTVPGIFDASERFLIEYWSKELGITQLRLHQAARIVGYDAAKIARQVERDVAVVARDDYGRLRKLARIVRMRDGIALSCPYHPAKNGVIIKTLQRYDRTIGYAPSEETFTVDGPVKLSIHLDGFVQFSRAGKEPIVSGRFADTGQAKGSGVLAHDKVIVTSGPLCGMLCKNPDSFDEFKPEASSASAEIFEHADFWHHPRVNQSKARHYHIEIFMFPRSRINEVREAANGLELVTHLPFVGMFDFPFHLRVIEYPGFWAFFGVAISRVFEDDLKSGYNLFGPGCGEPNGDKFAINAFYPRDDEIGPLKDVPSLNYVTTTPAAP